MRLIRMNRRSRYAGTDCLHCGKRVQDDRMALASTFYVSAPSTLPTTRYGSVVLPARFNTYSGTAAVQFEMRVVYHRRCVEGILARGLMDREEEKSRFDQYREQLLETYGPKAVGAS